MRSGLYAGAPLSTIPLYIILRTPLADQLSHRVAEAPTPRTALHKDTIKLIHLCKLSVEVQADAGIGQRNLGTLDVNVVKYETSIREIAKTSNMKVENIEVLLKNPRSMYKVMDFVKALRKTDPKTPALRPGFFIWRMGWRPAIRLSTIRFYRN